MLQEIFKNLVGVYILAKDTNRPWHMQHAFKADAVLEMELLTSNIEFPGHVEGRVGISETLVSNFGKSFENVYTFCLEDTVESHGDLLTCDWLVFMTEKGGSGLKVGWGTYAWQFSKSGVDEKVLAERLKIKIVQMDILPITLVDTVYPLITELPYPWVTVSELSEAIGVVNELVDLTDFLSRNSEKSK